MQYVSWSFMVQRMVQGMVSNPVACQQNEMNVTKRIVHTVQAFLGLYHDNRREKIVTTRANGLVQSPLTVIIIQ